VLTPDGPSRLQRRDGLVRAGLDLLDLGADGTLFCAFVPSMQAETDVRSASEH